MGGNSDIPVKQYTIMNRKGETKRIISKNWRKPSGTTRNGAPCAEGAVRDAHILSAIILGTALKKVGANAFAGTPNKATVTCPKKKIKAYTKLLQNAGL